MDKVMETILTMEKTKGHSRRVWIIHRPGGKVFTVTVETGDKLNNCGNKEN